jgi:uncharacterized protein (DUF2267 family)
VRGLYYDQWQPENEPTRIRDTDNFLERIAEGLSNIRPVNAREATRAVFAVLSGHLDEGQIVKVRQALPEAIRRELWPDQFVEAPDYSEQDA